MKNEKKNKSEKYTKGWKGFCYAMYSIVRVGKAIVKTKVNDEGQHSWNNNFYLVLSKKYFIYSYYM